MRPLIYLPAPCADNQLLFTLCGPKQSQADTYAGFIHNN